MARKLSPLTAQVVLDLNKWTAGIRQINRDADAIGKAIKPIGEQAKVLGTAMSAVGAAVGGTLLLMAKRAADFGDSLLTASQRTGVSTQQLAAFKLMADKSGTSFEALSKGVGLLSKNIVAAATGSKEQAKVFNAMGIAVKDASGQLRSASDIMPEIADRLSKIEDGALKTALAQKLFGKSGAELIPLLNEGSEGMRKAQEQAEKFGIALTKAEAALGNKFNEAMEDSKAAMQGFANAVGVALLPKLTELITKANEWIASASRWTKEHPELTKAIAATSGVIFGAGGLLLGLSGVITIAPKVYSSVMLMVSAFRSMAVVQGLSLITSMKDIPIALKLIGEQSLVAKGGVIALGAAMGYLIGQFINAKIEASGYQKEVDAIIQQASKFGALGPLGMMFSWMGPDPEGDTAAAAKANADLEAKAKQLGVTTDELRKRSVAAWEAQKKLTASQKAGVKPVDEMEKRVRDLMAAFEKSEAADKAAKDFKQFREAVDGIKFSVTDTTPPSKELVTAIHEMDKAGQMTSKAILNLAQHVDTLKNSKDPLIQQYVRMIPLMQLAAKSAEMEAEGLKLVADTTKEWADQLELVIPTATDLLSGLEDLKPLAPGDLVEATAITRVKELIDELDDLKDTVPNVERQVRLLRKEGKSNAEIMALMGGEMEAAARTAKQFNLPLGELTRTIIAQESRVQALRGAWGQTFANLSDHLVDMVTDFDFSFKRIGDIAKDTAKSLLRSFLDGFFKPFKDQLAGLGENLAGVLSGALFGGGGGGAKGGIGGALNGLLGMGGGGGLLGKIPGIGALLGGGAAVAGTTLAGSAAATSALASSLGLPAALSSIAPLAGPAGAAGAGGAAAGGFVGAAAPFVPFAGAAVAAATSILSNQLKDVADRFTPRQAEFDVAFAKSPDTEKAKLAIEYLADVYEFAQAGAGHTTIATQALETFEKFYGDLEKFGVALDLPDWSGVGLQRMEPGFFRDDIVPTMPAVNTVTTPSDSSTPDVRGGLTIGEIVIQLMTNAKSPEEWLAWLQNNTADIRTAIIRAVDLADGGNGSGLVTSH